MNKPKFNSFWIPSKWRDRFTKLCAENGIAYRVRNHKVKEIMALSMTDNGFIMINKILWA